MAPAETPVWPTRPLLQGCARIHASVSAVSLPAERHIVYCARARVWQVGGEGVEVAHATEGRGQAPAKARLTLPPDPKRPRSSCTIAAQPACVVRMQ